MKHKILVPLDGTAFGESILPKLETLVFNNAPGGEVEVILLRVISQVNYNMLTDNPAAQLAFSPDELKEMTAKEQSYLDPIAAQLKSRRIKVNTMIKIGRTAEEIVNAARETGVNLIAMSTHGHNGMVRWAIGSVTDKVLRLEGTIPVLAIRATKRQGNEVIALDSVQSMVHHS